MKILKFTASWCPSCRHMSNTIFDFPEDKRKLFKEIDIETDEGDNLATEYNVRSLPTLIFLDSENNILYKTTGNQTKKQLEDLISKYS